MKVLSIFFAGLLLTACEPPKKCLERKTSTVLMPMLVGKSMLMMPTTTSTCIRYEEK